MPFARGLVPVVVVWRVAWLAWAMLAGTVPAGGQVVISEFLADNQLGRKDDDGDREDWIELHNAGREPVSMNGWALTDDSNAPRKWEFPSNTISPGQFLLVYASGKDRRDAARPLHASFRLDADGEYLALLRPDGSVATAFSPAYPPQIPDVSLGFAVSASSEVLLTSGPAARFDVPQDDSRGTNWIDPDFDDRAWSIVSAGIGWDATGVLGPFIRTDVSPQMRGRNATGYLRVPFVVTNVADLDDLELRIRYDDGFAAYLNGYPIARRNVPVESSGGVIADQGDDWDQQGNQGVKGWYYGFYEPSNDSEARYDAFTDFVNVDPGWAWTGEGWTRGPGDPPWTTIQRDAWHPNGNTGRANVQWAIRRWVCQSAGTVKVMLAGAKENVSCGNGVTFRVLVNGGERFERAIGPKDATGFATTILLEGLDFGDFVDFALDPTGPDGDTQDGCDGSTFTVQILQDPSTGLTWNAAALRDRDATAAATVETIPVKGDRDRLIVGTNLLAFQVLNANAADADLLLVPELIARTSGIDDAHPLYFLNPSPGAANGEGIETLGAVIDGVTASPPIPAAADALTVTARVRPTLHPVAGVDLTYRVMYNAGTTIPMRDDGLHGDGAGGDGVWGAVIPARSASAGQMIRWSVTSTDTAGAALRSPRYLDPRRSPQYHGTVVADPSLGGTRLPVLHWFVQSPGSADGDAGTRASLFFEGEFYDNIGVNVHGQSTRGFPKKAYDFDFNPGGKFRWRDGQPRVDDFNLLTTWADKAHLRNVLAYETYALAGAPAHFAFSVRVQQNGRFHSVANLVENGDDNFLRRLGLDEQGALYKMYNVADSTSGSEKKTRKHEGSQDLAALIQGFGQGSSLVRQAFLFDQLNVPEVVNYLAARALTADTDCCHKNYYLYRDTLRSGEWSAFPWDVDLSFGRAWTCGNPCLGYFDETIYSNTGLYVGDNNRIFSLVLSTPATRQMYGRRVRSLMDELTQPPGVPPEQDRWRQRTTELRDQLAPDAALDLAKWGTWGRRETITQAVDRIHREFLPGRRQFLFTTQTRNGVIPQAQPSDAEVRIARVEARSGSTNRFQEYLVLTNANAYAVDISDWRLGGDIQFQFIPGTVLPAHSAAYASPNRRMLRARPTSPRGGERLLVLGDYSGELNAAGGIVQLQDAHGRLVHAYSLALDPSPAQRQLRITELMYHVPGGEEAGLVEYVELLNLGPTSLDLPGIRFTEGIGFDFSTGAIRTLAAGGRLLVVKDLAAFNAAYGPGLPIAGAFSGSLDNSGERLRLEDGDGESILDFHYEPESFPLADGLGFALVVASEQAPPAAWSDPGQWRPSPRRGGSPGATDPAPARIVPVVINEILAHTDPPRLDAVELHNPTGDTADLSGWWLTDDPGQPHKFRVPSGTTIAPHGFRVFDEADFNTPTNATTSFTFSSHGDEAWLFSASPEGTLSGYSDGVRFDASANGVSFGRLTNSVGHILFLAQREVTLGSANARPQVGPVVLSEIHFAPVRGDDAFVELKNISSTPVSLFDAAAPATTWRLDGLDFRFPPGVVLPAGGLLLVVSGDPVTFRRQHAVQDGIMVFGPWPGALQSNGERLAVERPDAPDPLPDGTVFIPWLAVDEVHYGRGGGWPLAAAEFGSSLERLQLTAYADDPAHWRLSSGSPTPGVEPGGNRPPIVTAGPEQSVESVQFPVILPLGGGFGDDGLPADPGRVTVTWSQVEGPGVAEFMNATLTNTTVLLPATGTYRLRLAASDGASTQAAETVIQLHRPDGTQRLVAEGAAWRYFAQDHTPAGGWNGPGFNDALWDQGEAQLGYGDGDERTSFSPTVNGSKVFTAYFRRAFDVVDPSLVNGLTIRLLADDGAVVWLNGAPALRLNMPAGETGYDTPAIATVSGTDESMFVEEALDTATLRAGANLLAVEVHQQNASSSDLSFDLQLQATLRTANRAPTVSAGPDFTVPLGTSVRLAASWSDDGLPGAPTVRWTQTQGPGPVTFDATNRGTPSVTFKTVGSYVLQFSVSDGERSASDDLGILVVQDPLEDYQAWRSRYFSVGELANDAVSGDGADADVDGQSNLSEFRSGTHPRDPLSVLRLAAELGTDGRLRLRLGMVSNRTYRLEWRALGTDRPWQILQTLQARPSDQIVTILDPQPPLGEQGRLYRVATP